MSFNRRTYQKEIDVNIQDQVSPPFHRTFMTEDKDDITLTSGLTKGDTVFNVSSGHGFVAGHELLLLYGSLFHQTTVLSVSTDAITVDSSIPTDVPVAGTQIIRGSIAMNVNGSSTPVVFYCRLGANSIPIDIIHLHVFMVDDVEGTDVLYGGIAALTNGCQVKMVDTVDINLGIYKNNQDFIKHGAVPNYAGKVGGSNYGMDFGFDLKNVYGTVLRLSNKGYPMITFTVRDDLTGLVEHELVATGQLTVGEE